ncbi:tRNA preQ1(34) S-adenosylmethionine ribosyltransferase-isomerase QueA [Desulfovirgula thermocuniculi]|uniref:tRNA preQ1(34) S-adenosylmethionine ribosyltransferase-isomerase QueA n=1 Tax=Desulfovirgula thermocuniculi TaxID=348842 RepID=UPI00040FC6D6|nr:tRNA preQ1(34) S-adenosylmethionine ribosyltransferase-isomerase QueA [Desulfovirgula thermocuniculi]
MSYSLSDYDFELPPELIAQEPAGRRDESRLLVLFRATGRLEHRLFRDLVEYLVPGDVLVLNETRVIPARLRAKKAGNGGEVELLLLRQLEGECWEALVRPGRRAKPGTRLVLGGGLAECVVGERTGTGGRRVYFSSPLPVSELIARLGEVPLPPYIKKYPQDPERYQTVYARRDGSVAAPTAGLHFTPELLERIEKSGVKIARILLHVGLGTFRPVRVEDITRHHMHAEYYEVSPEAAEVINGARAGGGRVVAVGTTSVRCLETVAGEDGRVKPGAGWTDLFIYPGYRFRAVDALITNFHLPRSTLLMLVSAFAGREKILAAYRVAVEKRYRFFSFGDAMLIL